MPTGIRSDTPTTLILIRHGESQSNVDRCFGGHSDTPLTARGTEQACATARFLADSEATHVISSDLPRAMQSAAPIAEALQLPLACTSGLRERSVGELDGKPFRVAQHERPELWQHLLGQDPHWCPPGGESVHTAFERMSCSLREIVNSNTGSKIILITHAISIHLGINALLGANSQEAMRRYFPVSNCSRSTFVVGPKRTQISGINQVEHLHLAT